MSATMQSVAQRCCSAKPHAQIRGRAFQATTCALRPMVPLPPPSNKLEKPHGVALGVVGAAAAAAVALSLTAGAVMPAHAGGKEKVAEFAASGFLIKDTVEVTALDDPEVEGVTIYFSDFKRSLVDKLSKDFFAEPSQASLACDISGPVHIKNEKNILGSEGHELFAERKGLNLFKDKTLRVRRVYDPERRTLIYVSYSTRLSDDSVTAGRYKTSLCTVHLPDPKPAPPVTAAPTVAAPVEVAGMPASAEIAAASALLAAGSSGSQQ